MSRTANTQQLGQLAETLASNYLLRQGLVLIARNYRCKLGEIDLIMRDGAQLVFVEVRFRRYHAFGSGSESVTYRKQQKLVRAAQFYLQQLRLTDAVACRFDVVALSNTTEQAPLTWIKDAFSA